MIKNILNASGIYKIVNTKTQKFYIGSTSNLYLRKNAHWCCLRNNKHENQYLQNSWNKYGEKYFRFEPTQFCSKIKLLEEEQKWLDKYFDNQNTCFNICSEAKNCLGVRHTAATKKKLSNIRKGNKNPFYGKLHTEETKKKISLANKGRLIGEKNPMYGRKGNLHPFFGKRGAAHHASIPVVQIEPMTNIIINIFDSMREAERQTQISHITIGRCCNKKIKTSGGYVWEYAPNTQNKK